MKIPFKIILVLLVTSLVQLSCDTDKKSANTANNSINEIQKGVVYLLTPNEFKEKSEGFKIVDIRTPYEFKQGYIKGAININYYNRNFIDNFINFDKDQPIFLYCRSGNRTSSAAKKLTKLGFQKVYDLKGGIINWSKNKNQIEK